MKIQNLLIEGFGKFSNMDLILGGGLNVIYGKNEAGKTTLKTFIYGMLYGFLKSGLKVRKYEAAYEKYRPWQVDQKYAGELVYTLSSKQRFRVKRDFNLDTVTVIDENTWQDLTKDFPVCLKECQFAQEHLGIEKEIFRDCVYIKQQNIDTIENPEALADRLQAIATTSKEELPLQTALDKLDNAINRVGTEKARIGSPLGRCIAKIEQLNNEHTDAKTKHDQLKLSIDELDVLTQQKSDLLKEQRQFQYFLACVESKEIETLLETIRNYNVNINQIEQELAILQPYHNFPVDSRDDLIIFQAQLSENKRRKDKLEVELCDNEKDQLELQGKLQALSGCKQIGERLEEIGSLETQRKLLIEQVRNDNVALTDLQDDFNRQSHLLTDNELHFNSMDNDQFMQILQDESSLQKNQDNLNLRDKEITRESDRFDSLTRHKHRLKKQVKFLIFGGAVTWIAATVLLTFSIPLSVFLFLVGLFGGFLSIHKRKQVKTLESQIDELSADIENKKEEFERDQQELAEAEKVMEDLFEQVSVSSTDELKAEYGKLQEQRQEVKRLKGRAEELNDELQKTREKLQKIERQIYDLISPALDLEEGSLDEQLELFRENYSRYESLRNQYNDAKEKGESLKSEHDDVSSTTDEIHAEIEQILEEAGVETPEEYSDGCEKHQQNQEGREEVKNLKKAHDNLLREQDLETWQQQLKQHQAQIHNLIDNHPDLIDTDFDLSDKATYQQERSQLSGEFHEMENQIHAVKARIEIQMANSRHLFEIEEELEQAILEKGILEKQKEALTLAKEQLEAVSQEFFTNSFAPELQEIVTPMLKTVAGQYSEIRFDEKLNLKVRIPGLNMIKDAGNLSQGTLDQIYFLLKAGVAQMFSKNGEPLPLLLDDPFVTCDDERLDRIWDILGNLASQTQILLFTCHHSQMLDVEKRFGSDANTVDSDVGDFTLLSIDA